MVIKDIIFIVIILLNNNLFATQERLGSEQSFPYVRCYTDWNSALAFLLPCRTSDNRFGSYRDGAALADNHIRNVSPAQAWSSTFASLIAFGLSCLLPITDLCFSSNVMVGNNNWSHIGIALQDT